MPWGRGGLQTPLAARFASDFCHQLHPELRTAHTHRLYHILKAAFFPRSKNLSLVSKEVLEFGRRSLSHMKPPLNICSECETWFVQRTWKSHKQWHLREPPVLGTALEGIIFQLHPTSQESCVDMSCWQVAPKDINAVLAFLFLPTPAHSGQLRRSCAGGQGSVWLCCD